jgi:hypothetical protein
LGWWSNLGLLPDRTIGYSVEMVEINDERRVLPADTGTVAADSAINFSELSEELSVG